MAGPVTHILVPMILLEVYRRYISKKKFSFNYVLLGGLAGVISDFDFLIMHANNLLNGCYTNAHRMGTHSLLLVILIALFATLFYWLAKKKARTAIHRKQLKIAATIFFLFAFGILTHIILDLFNGMILFAYPLSWSLSLPNLMYPHHVTLMVDGIFLVVWLLLDERVFNKLMAGLNRLEGRLIKSKNKKQKRARRSK
jgi:membrane-bound metal-dependent hydrolase YbcI (DUF457 family)